jgi:hypothetical protein
MFAACETIGKLSRAIAPKIGRVFFAADLKKSRLDRISCFFSSSSFVFIKLSF